MNTEDLRRLQAPLNTDTDFGCGRCCGQLIPLGEIKVLVSKSSRSRRRFVLDAG